MFYFIIKKKYFQELLKPFSLNQLQHNVVHLQICLQHQQQFAYNKTHLCIIASHRGQQLLRQIIVSCLAQLLRQQRRSVFNQLLHFLTQQPLQWRMDNLQLMDRALVQCQIPVTFHCTVHKIIQNAYKKKIRFHLQKKKETKEFY